MNQKFSSLLLLAALWCLLPVSAYATVSTLWPIMDYRASEELQYKSIHLAGPFIKYEEKGPETEYALRPLFYRAVDEEGVSQTDVLYPVFGHKREKESSSFNFFLLLNYDFGERESGTRNRSYLFPFLFYGQEEQGSYKAFFPIGGTMYNWFGRDRISFTLFPLYSQTQRGETVVDNYLWPFFARINGPDESGYKVWPIYGESSKQGVYEKRFFLWPIFYAERSRLNTGDPLVKRAAWPFYVSEESADFSYRAVLWPFFSKSVNHAKGYEVLNAPWPLVRITRGEKYYGRKFLPFHSDETMDARRERWYLWPLYKIETLSTELIERRRDRVLFFLYSDTKENKWETGGYKRRVDLWPLFGYQRVNGVSHLHILSLVEPFFPSNQSIERLWSPLWRIYQQKWDEQGNQVVSLLWNLYWHERRGDQVAWELFPLLSYRKESAVEKDVSFMKGLVRYQRDGEAKELKLFYLPWGIRWGGPAADTQE